MRRTARNTDARVVGLREQAFWPAISSRLGSTVRRGRQVCNEEQGLDIRMSGMSPTPSRLSEESDGPPPRSTLSTGARCPSTAWMGHGAHAKEFDLFLLVSFVAMRNAGAGTNVTDCENALETNLRPCQY